MRSTLVDQMLLNSIFGDMEYHLPASKSAILIAILYHGFIDGSNDILTDKKKTILPEGLVPRHYCADAFKTHTLLVFIGDTKCHFLFSGTVKTAD